MDAMDVVLAWDRSHRDGDWDRARSLLAGDASYKGAEELDASFNCTNGDQIVFEWKTVVESVVARLRQPAWGEDAD